MSFFDLLLPESGYICVARLLEKGNFAHVFFEDVETAVEYLTQKDNQGHTMYLAQAGFSTTAYQNWLYNKENRQQDRRKERTQANVHMVRSFWLDIDCGAEKFEKDPEKSYPSQRDAALDIRRLLDETSLPCPTIVNSGNGLYAHWFLDRDIDEQLWRSTALLLKNVLLAHQFKADPQRTADSASVLRPPGTHNRKHGLVKPVRIIGRLTDPEPFPSFLEQLKTLASRKKIALSAFSAPKDPGLNSEFMIEETYASSSAYEIAEHCLQVRTIRDTLGDVSEPLWYAGIGLLRHTEESSEIIHKWS